MAKNSFEIENTFNKMIEDLHNDPEYYAELLKLEITENIYKLMKDKGIKKTELAKKMGCKPPYITKLLSGSTNLTIDSLAKIAFILDAKWIVKIDSKQSDNTFDWGFENQKGKIFNFDEYTDKVKIYNDTNKKAVCLG